MEIEVNSLKELTVFGARFGSLLKGGEVIELIGDVGAGKTALVKAIAAGMGVMSDVGSPSYVLSQVYEAPSGLRLAHYDFYRLDDPGILADELREALVDPRTVTAIEWADIVANVLPEDHVRIRIVPIDENSRQLSITSGGSASSRLLEQLK